MTKHVEKPDPHIPVIRGQFFYEHGIPWFIHAGHLSYLRTCRLIDPAGKLNKRG